MEVLPFNPGVLMWFRYSNRWSAKHYRAVDNRHTRNHQLKKRMDERAIDLAEDQLEELAKEWVAIDDADDLLWNKISLYQEAEDVEMVVFGEDGQSLEGWRGELSRHSDGTVTGISEERLKVLATDIARRALVCSTGAMRLSDFVEAARSEGIASDDVYALMERIVAVDPLIERYSRSTYRYAALEFEYDPWMKAEIKVAEWQKAKEQQKEAMARERSRRRDELSAMSARDRVRTILKEALLANGRPMRLVELSKALQESGLRFASYSSTIANHIKDWDELEKIEKGIYGLKSDRDGRGAAAWGTVEIAAQKSAPEGDRGQAKDVAQPLPELTGGGSSVKADADEPVEISSDVDESDVLLGKNLNLQEEQKVSDAMPSFGELGVFLRAQIAKGGRPMKISELRDAALAHGYRGKHPYQHISAVLQRNLSFKRVGRAEFDLAEPQQAADTRVGRQQQAPVDSDDGSVAEKQVAPIQASPPMEVNSSRKASMPTKAGPSKNIKPAKPQVPTNSRTPRLEQRTIISAEQEKRAKAIVRSTLSQVGQKIILRTLLDAMVSGTPGLDDRAAYKLLLKWKVVKITPVTKKST
jgi:hypothetical protein